MTPPTTGPMGTPPLLYGDDADSVVVVCSVSCVLRGVVFCTSVGLGLDGSGVCSVSLSEVLVAASGAEADLELDIVEIDESALPSVSEDV